MSPRVIPHIYFSIVIFALCVIFTVSFGCRGQKTAFELRLGDIRSLPQGYRELPEGSLPTMCDVKAAYQYTNPLDADSIELFVYRGDTVYHPVNMLHRAQAFIIAYSTTHDQTFLLRAKKYVDKLVSLSVVSDGALFYPYSFRYSVHGDSSITFVPPWFSGMAQGEMLIVLCRLQEITKDDKYLNLANKTFRSLLLLRSDTTKPWVARIDSDGFYWIEEYPHNQRPGQTLNGYIAALYGVYDYYRLTKKPIARQLYNTALTTVKHYLPYYRTPHQTSFYCIGHHIKASEGYHKLHIKMMDKLFHLTGDPIFSVFKDIFLYDVANEN